LVVEGDGAAGGQLNALWANGEHGSWVGGWCDRSARSKRLDP
jgi:hypothetical protein